MASTRRPSRPLRSAPPPRQPQSPPASSATAPAGVRPPTRQSPTLREVTRADLRDVRRLLAWHQQASARGGLWAGEAGQLSVVAAAMPAQRVDQAPCRLCVALLRAQRWDVITQKDEERARTLLREHADGPCRRGARAPAATVPAMPLSDDARRVLRAPQVLRQARWRGALGAGAGGTHAVARAAGAGPPAGQRLGAAGGAVGGRGGHRGGGLNVEIRRS